MKACCKWKNREIHSICSCAKIALIALTQLTCWESRKPKPKISYLLSKHLKVFEIKYSLDIRAFGRKYIRKLNL